MAAKPRYWISIVAAVIVIVGGTLLVRHLRDSGERILVAQLPTGPTVVQPVPVGLGVSDLEQSHLRTNDNSIPLETGGDSTPRLSEKSMNVLSGALRCYNHIEDLKTTMSGKGENVQRVLDALQTELFKDDWAMATLYEPRLQTTKAEDGLDAMLNMGDDNRSEGLGKLLSDAGIPTTSPEPQAGGTGGIEILQEHYQIRLQGGVEGFADVAEVLDKFTVDIPQYLETDLLKDAWSYASSRTVLDQRYREIEEKFNSKELEIADLKSRLGESNAANLRRGAAGVAQLLTADVENMEAAYEEVYRWRFGEIHHLEDVGAVIQSLNTVELANPSPVDLGIPAYSK